MFDLFRKHTKILMFLLFLLIIPAFVLVGVDSYTRMSDKAVTVAVVGSQKITQTQWDNAHRNEVQRIQASMPDVDIKLLDSPQARYATLERLVREYVIQEAATQSHFVTSDERLARELQQDKAIASLRKPDGTLDKEGYKQLAASRGLTPEGYEERVRSNLSLKQVEAGLTASGFSATSLADVSLNAFLEKREVQVARFVGADYASKINPTDAELEDYYKANQGQFQAPESAAIEYAVLDLDAIKKTIVLNEQDVKTYYEQNATRLNGVEERQARHILVQLAKGASAADREKAKARATELLSSAQKSPASFAELAKKNSQDSATAPAGGDLGFFAQGAMVKPFSDAVFSMKKGEISNLVESEFGYHIIQLVDIKLPKAGKFEDHRASIESDLKTQQARVKYPEAADTFTNLVFEDSGSLKTAADKLKMDIKTATQVLRVPQSGATGPLASPKFLEAVFASDTVEKKLNTKAIEVAPYQMVAARVTQYAPARTLPFADVRARVREQFIAARGVEMAKKEGADKLTLWKSTPSSAVVGPAVIVSRDQTQSLHPKVLQAVLRADLNQAPVFVGVDLSEQGYAIARVNKRVTREALGDDMTKQGRAQYGQWWGGAEGAAYYELLKQRFNAEIKVSKPSLASSTKSDSAAPSATN